MKRLSHFDRKGRPKYPPVAPTALGLCASYSNSAQVSHARPSASSGALEELVEACLGVEPPEARGLLRCAVPSDEAPNCGVLSCGTDRAAGDWMPGVISDFDSEE